MKHARILDPQWLEPMFELPPRFVGVHDRRLGGRVAAQWADQRSGQSLPLAEDLRAAIKSGGANLVWLQARGTAIVTDVGGALAAAFGLQSGLLAEGSPFADALRRAFDRSTADAAPVQFEGGFARYPAAPATLLTRGTVVPLAGEVGVGTACAIVTWTELLPPADNDRLRCDLLSALTVAPRAKVPACALW